MGGGGGVVSVQSQYILILQERTSPREGHTRDAITIMTRLHKTKDFSCRLMFLWKGGGGVKAY